LDAFHKDPENPDAAVLRRRQSMSRLKFARNMKPESRSWKRASTTSKRTSKG
jgi:hypothetical protein